MTCFQEIRALEPRPEGRGLPREMLVIDVQTVRRRGL
jgi:hypothetical protein